MKHEVAARWAGALIGSWLFVSAFTWRHSPEEFYNSWVIGLTAFLASIFAVEFEWTRFANLLMALWLFSSGWVLHVSSPDTFWNNVVVAILMFAIALTPRPPHLRSKGAPGVVHHSG